MEIRSALLKSETTRNNLRPGMEQWGYVSQALAAIDRIGGMYDALRRVHESQNPHETPEARAMRYEKQFNKVMEEAYKVSGRAADGLASMAETIRAKALEQSGLMLRPASEQEIRASLRALPQAERDKVITDAFERGDTELLASIYGRNHVTWGGTTIPLDKHFDLFIEKAAPDSMLDREARDKTMEGLTLAVDTFLKSAEKWRDPLTAARGFEQEQEYEQAEAALNAFLGGAE